MKNNIEKAFDVLYNYAKTYNRYLSIFFESLITRLIFISLFLLTFILDILEETEKYVLILNSIDLLTILILIITGFMLLVIVGISPTKMTVIAGICIGFVSAMLVVEGFVSANQYMTKRLEASRVE